MNKSDQAARMIYLTYAEPPSGVYASQVIDVIRYLNEKLDARIRLVAFISLHDFSKNKSVIKQSLPDAWVLPMLPKAEYWRVNIITLWFACLFLRPAAIIARNVIAANMALAIRGSGLIKKVCFDGRGAIAAEWKEYDVQVSGSWKKEIDQLENKAVNNSDQRIAVTQKLVEYWKRVYNYKGTAHVVIPCTLNSGFKAKVPVASQIAEQRTKLGLDNNDIVLAYSGSTAGWQSFESLQKILSHYLSSSPKYKVLFLAKEEENISRLDKLFPGQVLRSWVNHKEVPLILSACDLGILIREQSVTNEVASPTKFAEYLSAGLPVFISEKLGDYTDFVKEKNCGYVLNGSGLPQIPANTDSKREELVSLVMATCSKETFIPEYKKLLAALRS